MMIVKALDYKSSLVTKIKLFSFPPIMVYIFNLHDEQDKYSKPRRL